MQLTDLLEGEDEQDMQAAGEETRQITGLTADSRLVKPGYLFAALPGSRADGRDFIADAVTRGASAVLAPVDSAFRVSKDIGVVTAENPRRLYARMAARFHGRQPAHMAAVTGTNGKTSVADFARQIWSHQGRRAASVGTLGIITSSGWRRGSLTTPDPADLHASLKALAETHVTHAALEASSHGLDQHRLDGVRIGVAAFTNLSRDHLDYHGDMENYLAAKLRLFTEVLTPGGAVVMNSDDPVSRKVWDAATGVGAMVTTVGLAGDDISLGAVSPAAGGLDMTFILAGSRHHVRLPLAGGFQAMNALIALGIVIADGSDAGTAIEALPHLKGVPGRLEKISDYRDGAVYVDYAHTPDAVTAALDAIRPHTRGKLIAIIGCGGDRDPGKRASMGAAAVSGADEVIVTDDNPRTEDPASIRAAVLEGAPAATEIGDRRDAIRRAVRMIGPGDVVLVAGKGHEEGQIVGDDILPFNDAGVIRDVIGELGG